MADQRVVDYMKTQLSRGFALDQIRKGLISQGWKREEVEEAAQSLSRKDFSAVKDGQVPGLVKFLSILCYIETAILVLSGLSLIFFQSFLNSLGLFGSFLSMMTTSFIGGNVFLITGIFLIGLGILYFFMARGLWMGQNWARIIVVVFSIISMLGAIPVLTFVSYSVYVISSIVEVVISGAIAGYLLFSKRVRDAFRKV